MYSDMSIRTIASSRVEHELRQRPRQLGLADAGRAEEQERADRAVGVLQARAGAAQRARDRLDRLVLADDPFVQALLHVDQLLDLALQQAAHGDARPARHHLGDVVGLDLLLEEHRPLPAVGSPELGSPDSCSASLPFQLGDLAVAQLGRPLQVGGALGPLGLHARLLQPRLELA